MTILIVSLLLAFFIWLSRNLNQDYFTYRQFLVTVVTDIDGYAPSAVSSGTVSVGGQAKGYDLIKRRSSARHPKEITIHMDASSFVPDDGHENTFTVDSKVLKKYLADASGSDFIVSTIPQDEVSFVFSPQSCKKVPVEIPEVDIVCDPQYMQIDGVKLMPDSVLVYGNSDKLARLQRVYTRPLRLQNLSGETSGEIPLRPVPGLRFGSRIINYRINVDRYVEQSLDVDITVNDVPADRKVILLPSTVRVVCRLPFSEKTVLDKSDMDFSVDYEELYGLHGMKFIPKMRSSACTVYSYQTQPKMVDFIISEVD